MYFSDTDISSIMLDSDIEKQVPLWLTVGCGIFLALPSIFSKECFNSGACSTWGRPRKQPRISPMRTLNRPNTFHLGQNVTRLTSMITASPNFYMRPSLCLCGEEDLWQIYGGAKGINPASMLDRVCNGLWTGKMCSTLFTLSFDKARGN